MSSPNPHAIDADTLSGMKPLRKVVYSIGSNLGDRLGNVQGAVDALSDTPDVIVVDISSVYETKPFGGPPDSPLFLNIVVIAETTLGAADSGRARLCDRRCLWPYSRRGALGSPHPGRGFDHGRYCGGRSGGAEAAASDGARTRIRPRAVVRG